MTALSAPRPGAFAAASAFRLNPALLIAALAVLGFVGYPLLSALGVVHLQDLAAVVSESNREPMVNSILLAAFTIVPATLIGVPLAWLCARTDLPAKGLLAAMVSISFVVPVLLTSVAYVFLLGKNAGLLNQLAIALGGSALYNIYSFSGVVVLCVLHTYPLVFFTTLGGLSKMNPELEEAGRVAGLSPVGVFFRITLGAILPSIMAGVTFVAAESLTVLAAPLLLGAPVQVRFMTTELFGTIVMNPNLSAAVALSLPLVAVTLVMVAAQSWLVGGAGSAKFAVLGGKGARSETVRLGKWKWPAVAAAGVPVFFSLVLPVLTLLLAGFMDRWWKGFRLSNLSVRNFMFLAEDRGTLAAIGNSLLLAVGVGALMAIFGAVLAILVAGEQSPAKRVIRSLAAVPLGLPHVVAAILVILAWYGAPFKLGGSLWILAFGYIFVMIPYALRTCDAARGQIDAALSEAAHVAGMSSVQTWRYVMLPLMKSGVVTTFLIVFLFTIKEFSLTALLYSAETTTLPVLIYSFLEGGSYERTAAASMLLLLLTLASLAVASRVFRISLTSLKV
ncbi:MAG: iron ABC transporter permease [Pseudomonadota bacterium]